MADQAILPKIRNQKSAASGALFKILYCLTAISRAWLERGLEQLVSKTGWPLKAILNYHLPCGWINSFWRLISRPYFHALDQINLAGHPRRNSGSIIIVVVLNDFDPKDFEFKNNNNTTRKNSGAQIAENSHPGANLRPQNAHFQQIIFSRSNLRFPFFALQCLTMDTETSYNLALDYLYSFVDYSLKHSSELAKADFNLDRMRALMSALGNPQENYPCIHVAGTKGKGSTSAFCASALQTGGLKVGLYTSPHLQEYTERIQVNLTPITQDELVDLVELVKPQVAKIPLLTTFEITTALAFVHFARIKVDAAVIEVGLGGRLDATNILTPRVSVITSLSYDHTAVLGNTLTLIAGEKAGIIKPGIPVVSSPQKEEALKVLEKVAAERGCALTLIGRDVPYSQIEHALDGQTLQIASSPELPPLTLRIPLLGSHQVENAVTAYAALKMSGLALSDAQIAQGFAQVRWPCRFEIASREPVVIFDSAHNEDAFVRLAQTLETYFPNRKAVLILGISEDKHLQAMLAAIKPLIDTLIVTRADHPRALEPEKIIATARSIELQTEAVTPVETALDRALEIAKKNGSIILSAGSMFVTAEVKTAWQKKVKQP